MTDSAFHSQNYWKLCSSCKKEIPFRALYQVCSVSTCRGKKLGFHFCSVACWDAHLGFANHRSSSAEEMRAPSKEEYAKECIGEVEEPQPRKILVRPADNPRTHSDEKIETLVVVSKVKSLINERSQFNTSQCAIDALTQKVVDECLKAIKNATSAGRKTVMGRDIL